MSGKKGHRRIKKKSDGRVRVVRRQGKKGGGKGERHTEVTKGKERIKGGGRNAITRRDSGRDNQR